MTSPRSPGRAIHVRLPKTASSTLQHHAFENHSDIDYLGRLAIERELQPFLPPVDFIVGDCRIVMALREPVELIELPYFYTMVRRRVPGGPCVEPHERFRLSIRDWGLSLGRYGYATS